MSSLTFKPIDLNKNTELAIQFRNDAFICSYAEENSFKPTDKYIKWLSKKIDKAPELAMHVWLNDEIIGQLEITTFEEVLYINLYYLAPKYRSKGYGVKLHEYILSIAKKNKIKNLELSVAIKNTTAIGFYQKVGFIKGKQIKRGGIECYLMSIKNLKY